MKRIVERLDAETVARSEQRPVALIPDRERELAAQRVDDAGAMLLVEMEGDLAVGAGAERVAARIRSSRAETLEIVELAVGDELKPPGLVGDRLTAGLEVHDAQARMAERRAAARRHRDRCCASGPRWRRQATAR